MVLAWARAKPGFFFGDGGFDFFCGEDERNE